MREPRATLDFESRSACDLKKHGSWRYSLDPSTEVLCLVFRLPFWEESRAELWHPAFDHLGIEEADCWSSIAELFGWISGGGAVEAHNAFFERGMWLNQMVAKYGWPEINSAQWRCSAAKAASHALPRGLEGVTSVLNLDIRKDEDGHALMLKVSKPRKPLKREIDEWNNRHNAGKCVACKGKGTYKRKPCVVCGGKGQFPQDVATVPAMPLLWHESRELFERLWSYCVVDVLAESGVSDALPDLNARENDLYILDQIVNERGFQLDKDAVKAALDLIARETTRLNGELARVTGGEVVKATQRARMQKWFEGQGLILENTQAATIDDALKDEENTPLVKEALEIVRELGRSSTAKYQSMQRWACPDGRVRGGLLYHGSSTGRWSGSGVQPHNFVRGTIKISQDELWTILKTGNCQHIVTSVDEKGKPLRSVMLALSNGLRGAICAAPGMQLFVADYASIEARVLLWVAEDDEHLDIFRRNEDVYLTMADRIYHRKCTKADIMERQLGKAATLGCGYQMGFAKFVSTAAAYGVTITEDFSKQVVDAYRSEFWRVKQLWYDVEAAAIQCVETGDPVECGRIRWEMEEPESSFDEPRFLYCLLPSGRRLAYPFPEIRPHRTSWGAIKDALTIEGVNSYNHQWQRQAVYGGLLVENIVQAVSRDLMAEAMMRCEESGTYQPVLSVHDELIAEAVEGTGNVKEFEALMCEGSEWAEGLPIKAEGWTGFRYKK